MAILRTRRRRTLSWRAWGLVALSAALAACRYPATELLVTLDTDAPIDRAMTVSISVTGAQMIATDGSTAMFVRGGATAGATLPGSFAVTPRGATDSPVTLTIDAQVAGDSNGHPPVTFRRIARFNFVLRATTALPVFLPVSCGNLTVGCMRTDAAHCNVSALCEEQGQTCGDDGRCVSQQVTPVASDGGLTLPTVDVASADASNDVTDVFDSGGDTGLDAFDAADVVLDAAADARDATDVAMGMGFDSSIACDAANAIMCGTTCVDRTRDAHNCGTCGTTCPVACSAGVCVTVASVVGAHYGTCATLSDGTVRCWGIENNHELGLRRYSYPRPTEVTGLTSITQVVIGEDHGCALRGDHSVLCWGDNTTGAYGDGTTNSRAMLIGPVPGLLDAVELATGRAHTCARRTDGTVVCWGNNDSGAAGQTSRSNCVVRPADPDAGVVANSVPCTLSPAPIANVVGATQITSGTSHTCALTGGSVLCWGSNEQNQLGYSTATMCVHPATQDDAGMGAAFACSRDAQAVPGITTAVRIVAGGLQTCAALADNTIRCWGHDDEGQLGDGMRTDRLMPGPVLSSSGASFMLGGAMLAGGFDHMAAFVAGGPLYVWGNGANGQIGNGTMNSSLFPFLVPGMTDLAAVSLGWYHTCARTQLGALRCWGNNADNELGNASGMDSVVPVTPLW